MANVKISAQTAATTPLTGTEVVAGAQSLAGVKITTQSIADLAIPSQTGNSGKYLTTNGTSTSWGTVAAGDLSDAFSAAWVGF